MEQSQQESSTKVMKVLGVGLRANALIISEEKMMVWKLVNISLQAMMARRQTRDTTSKELQVDADCLGFIFGPEVPTMQQSN